MDDFDELYDKYALLDDRYCCLYHLEEKMNAEDGPAGMKTPEFLAAYKNARATYNRKIADLIPVYEAAETAEEIEAVRYAYDEAEGLFRNTLDAMTGLLPDEDKSGLEKKLLRLYIDDLSKATTAEELDEVLVVYDARGALLLLKEEKCERLQSYIAEYPFLRQNDLIKKCFSR